MSTSFPFPVQADSFSLAGAGAIIGDTSIVLKSFLDINGVQLTMPSFGTVGYLTMEPGNGTQEEQISFTGITANANGTTTLTGISSVLFITPYTKTSGLSKTHPGSTEVVISNTSGFYNDIKGYIDTAIVSGAVPSTISVNGIGRVSVNPVDPANPIFVGDNDPRIPSAGASAALAGLSGTTPGATNLFVDSNALTGIISPFGGRVAPTGFLMCDGSAVSRTTYARLLSVIAPFGTVTISIASPAVFTKTAHGLVTGDKVHFTTTGGLPSGLSTNTDYYVISTGLTTNAFEVAVSPGGAAINTSGSQSGVQTVYASGWGKGDGATTFNVPDLRSKFPVGMGASSTISLVVEAASVSAGGDLFNLTSDISGRSYPSQGQLVQLTTTGTLPAGLSLATNYYIIRLSNTQIQFATTQANANAATAVPVNITDQGTGVHSINYTLSGRTIMGLAFGEEAHSLSVGELATHTHTSSLQNLNATDGGAVLQGRSTANSTSTSDPTGSNALHNNMPPSVMLNYVIKV